MGMKHQESSFLGGLTRWVVKLVVRQYYGRLEIAGGERIPRTGAVLICSNHANSLLDPVLVGIAARRPVRFLAKAPLFKMPVLGPTMAALGMIPAYRAVDDRSSVRRNLESLDIGAAALAEGSAMGIFPEGKSHDQAHVEKIGSGAARIAMQAVEQGAAGLLVVPVGINYQRKEQFRSAVWIRVGEPIDAEAWLSEHDGDVRKAARALSTELAPRLASLVVHLDNPDWQPLLDDLEVLVAQPAGVRKSRLGPLQHRKRIADAVNHFAATDPDRTRETAGQIESYRRGVEQAGLRVDSPVLRRRGLSLVVRLLWRLVWLVAWFLPALVGTMHHLVPFVLVRNVASRLSPPGRTAIALYRLLVGLPIYGLWYAVVALWMFDYFAGWFAWTWLLAMPFAGVVALSYWRRIGRATAVWWRQISCIVHRGRRRELCRMQAELGAKLTELGAEYDKVVPPSAAVPRHGLAARLAVFGVCIAAVLALAAVVWFALPWVFEQSIAVAGNGPDLAGMPEKRLKAELDTAEKSLLDIIHGLDDLEARAVKIHDEFAAGTRSYVNQQDNDAVRQLLLSYINYRSALVRIIWRFQQHAGVAEARPRFRAFLLDYTAASLLYEASLKFVHQFNRSDETVKKLNEGEQIWNIPPGMYDRIRENLASRENRRLLGFAGVLYERREPKFAAHKLVDGEPYTTFHRVIRRSRRTAAEIGEDVWKEKFDVSIQGAKKLVYNIRYETQSVVSTWIGDFKIRKPRNNQPMIQPEQLDRLRQQLQPGDILLERRNWYLSNAFLPGFWPHAAIYVGTAEDLKSMGLDSDEHVRKHWAKFIQPDHQGHEHVIIEAISEGVIFSSLEHSIGGADSVAVLRPQLTPQQKQAAVARAFSHAGKPYDFEFDFSTTDKLVCTEVVYRCYSQELNLQDQLVTILGRKTLPAIRFVEKYRQEQGDAKPDLKMVAFLDGDETTGRAAPKGEAAFVATLALPGPTWLHSKTATVKQIGPLGWIVLGLPVLFALGIAVRKVAAKLTTSALSVSILCKLE